MFNLGMSAFSATPVYSVMSNALRDSIKETIKKLTSIQSEWNSVIVNIPNENQFVIPAGKLAGIKVGDQFEVYNVEHIWSDPDKPCESAYRQAIPNPEQPIAIVEVRSEKDLTPNSTVLRTKEILLPNKIERGSFVYAHNLAADRNLKRSVKLKTIRPFKIKWKIDEEIKETDLTPFLESAIGPILDENSLYIKDRKPSRNPLF